MKKNIKYVIILNNVFYKYKTYTYRSISFLFGGIMNFTFFLNNILLGIGLTMDAFSVSLANGFKEPCMKNKKALLIALTFGLFQMIMPLIGWICVHTLLEKFKIFAHFIPWIALVLLLYIGGKMVIGFFFKKEEQEECSKTGFLAIIIQGIATSIDALSVGFTIAEYNFTLAFVATLIIGIITFIVCFIGVFLGKKFGTKCSTYAELIGGLILIAIGIEIFVTGMINLYS